MVPQREHSMNLQHLIQIADFVIISLALAKLLGISSARRFTNGRTVLSPLLGSIPGHPAFIMASASPRIRTGRPSCSRPR